MPPSIFLRAARRTKPPNRTPLSLRDACCFIETFVNGGQRCYASLITHSARSAPPDSDQPPSHRPFDSRQNLLHRTYLSLLRATPLLVFFQHNNLKGNELVAIRRDLRNVMANVDAQIAASQPPPEPAEDGTLPPKTRPIGNHVKMTIVNTELLSAALRVAEYLPKDFNKGSSSGPEAYRLTMGYKKVHPLEPFLVGPVGLVQFPTISPPHLLAVLNLLFPEKATFKKGTDPAFISGVSKLLLLGAKIDKIGGRTIDTAALRYITSLGDITTLRGQLLGIMQSAGAGLVATLQSPSKGLWVMMEGRRKMLDPETQKEAEAGASDAPAA
ncbi:hypothetical protein TWF694_009896 [Orbilia ellipsospora]|uniref:Uncharacterized protein n=1 Tax=Orbilia ellipsospora TaxID=2528407 RepID=A0AAV9XFD2_9PEZI